MNKLVTTFNYNSTNNYARPVCFKNKITVFLTISFLLFFGYAMPLHIYIYNVYLEVHYYSHYIAFLLFICCYNSFHRILYDLFQDCYLQIHNSFSQTMGVQTQLPLSMANAKGIILVHGKWQL